MRDRIISMFRSISTFASDGEVALFRALAKAIDQHSPATFIDETHGANVCNVGFTSVVGQLETCEIADLLIISYASPARIRATFWQAKKESRPLWLSGRSGEEQLDFKGQFNQWDLLSRRPQVSGVGRFQPPQDLLSSFESASIGSFGVFHQRQGASEVSHSVAQFLTCPNPRTVHPKMAINGYLAPYTLGHGEVICRMTLKPFLGSLFGFQVGALLTPAAPAHRWLIQYALSKLTALNSASSHSPIFRQFLNGAPHQEAMADASGDGLSVLIVPTQAIWALVPPEPLSPPATPA